MAKRKSMKKCDYAKQLGVTTQTIRNWIEINPDLKRKLNQAGRGNVLKRIWTPAELYILDEYFRDDTF